jgi:hypothetical protein
MMVAIFPSVDSLSAGTPRKGPFDEHELFEKTGIVSDDIRRPVGSD